RILAFHDDAGHPLAYPGGNAADGFDRDPAFAVPVEGRWCWITAFSTGLVVCSPEARPALAGSLSLVWDRRVAWPAHWAVGTDVVEVHDDWPAALASTRLPDTLPAAWRTWVAQHHTPAKRIAGFDTVDPWTGPELDWARKWLPVRTPTAVEIPKRPPGYY